MFISSFIVIQWPLPQSHELFLLFCDYHDTLILLHIWCWTGIQLFLTQWFYHYWLWNISCSVTILPLSQWCAELFQVQWLSTTMYSMFPCSMTILKLSQWCVELFQVQWLSSTMYLNVVNLSLFSDHTKTITTVCWTVSSSVAISHNVFNFFLFGDHPLSGFYLFVPSKYHRAGIFHLLFPLCWLSSKFSILKGRVIVLLLPAVNISSCQAIIVKFTRCSSFFMFSDWSIIKRFLFPCQVTTVTMFKFCPCQVATSTILTNV